MHQEALPHWTLKRSSRSRRLAITVHRDGSVVVRAPFAASFPVIEKFVAERVEWITKAVQKMARFKNDAFLPRDRRTYLANKEAARQMVHELLAIYAPRYGAKFGTVSIKNMRRNWGSCSELGNLNFNYKLAFLPRTLAAYVVVHELCHLRIFNHSKAFWQLVAQEMPDHKELRRQLRRYHS